MWFSRFGRSGSNKTDKSGDGLMAENPVLFGNVYKGRKVLVTGHTGFKGSWLSFWLHDLGAQVAGYATEAPTEPNLFGELELGGLIADVSGDVRDHDRLQAFLHEFQPEIIFHLAAQSLVRPSYLEPRLTYETNVMGTVNVLEAARACESVRVVINVTSDKCYENQERDYSYREGDPMGGHDPYSSSKGCAELVTTAYTRSFFDADSRVSLASVRAGNVVGGGDWARDRIIPDCVRALSSGEPIAVRNPGAIRPWQHVLEPLSGYLFLASRMWQGDHAFDGPWNFGPEGDGNVPVQTVVEAALDAWGEGSWEGPPAGATGPHEALFLKLDCTKARETLGWRPVYGIGVTLRITMDWYKAYYNQGNARALTAENINDYVKAAGEKRLGWTI